MTSRGVIFAIVTIAAGALVPGCPSNLEPLYVAAFVPLVASEGSCTAQQSTQPQETAGIYDVGLAATLGGLPGYAVGIAVTSQLNGAVIQPGMNGTQTAGPVIDNYPVELESAEVTYQLLNTTGGSNSTVNFGPAYVTVGGLVQPGTTLSIPQEILQPDVAAKLLTGVTSGTLVATITLSGKTLDETGDPAESVGVTPATFSIQICDGCLLETGAGDIPEIDVGGTACPLTSATSACFGNMFAQPDGLECSTGTVTNTATTDGGMD